MRLDDETRELVRIEMRRRLNDLYFGRFVTPGLRRNMLAKVDRDRARIRKRRAA